MSVVLCFSLAVTPVALAKPNDASTKIESKQAQAETVAKKLIKLQADLEVSGTEIEKINAKIKITEKKISETKKKISKANKTLKAAQKELSKSVAETYRFGEVSFISVLLNSVSFDEFSSKLYFFEKISEERASAIDEVMKEKTDLSSQQASLKTSLASQKNLKKQAEEKNAATLAAVESQQDLLDSIDAEMLALVNDQSDEIVSDSSIPTHSAAEIGTTSKKGNHALVVNIAKRYLGVKYVWGGTSPSGFDCSGLVQYCYAKAGISLNRVACDQYDNGTPVKKSALMPGDLVFFGKTKSTIHHVGIYVGGGKYIHAPHTGDVVKISKLSYRSDYYGACRPR